MNDNIHNDPLVSIIVITYNSAEFVLETLESAKNQTYTNLELIISDDCSKDNTLDICNEWLKVNAGRFVRTELLTVEKNTGISPNCNRGFRAAKGEWVKPIAGDDILCENCVETFIHYTKIHPDISFFFSDMIIFGKGNSSEKRDSVRNWLDRSIKRAESLQTAVKQYKGLKLGNFVSAPSSFHNLKSFRNLGGFDETIKLIEDYPFWLIATKNGYLIKSISDRLVKYRVDMQSVQTSKTYKIAFELFHQKYIFKNIFYDLFSKYINQLNVQTKDSYITNLLIGFAYPQRVIWKLKKKMLL